MVRVLPRLTRIPEDPSTIAWLLLPLVLGTGLAGCIGPSGPVDAGPPGDPVGMVTLGRSVLHDVAIINETDDGQVRLTVHQRTDPEDCYFQSKEGFRLRGSYVVYDRYGKIIEEPFELDNDVRSRSFDLDLDGTPPFAIAGDWNACYDTRKSNLTGIVEGFQPYRFETTSSMQSVNISLEVARGEDRTVSRWTPSPFARELFQAVPEWDNRTGDRYGTISLIDSTGRTLCQEHYKPGEGWDVDCEPSYRHPGTYRIVLELDHPATRPTVWPYRIDVPSFHDGICDYGFAWEGLCT